MSVGGRLRMLARLGRPRLSIFVALSAAAGHAAAGQASAALLGPALACLLLAAGASALNQVQERDGDARMQRTRGRPLPAGAISPGEAMLVASVLLLAGLALLAGAGWLPLLLGALAVVCYNGIYTPLKVRTAFAAVPGALIGSLGPAIGWTAAGGALTDAGLLALMILFYLWQVPHFWLLSLAHRADYQGAGYPSPVDRFGPRRLGRLIIAWSTCALLTGLALPLFGLLQHLGLYLLLCAAALLAAAALLGLLPRPGSDWVLRRGFAGINVYALVTMLLLIVDGGL